MKKVPSACMRQKECLCAICRLPSKGEALVKQCFDRIQSSPQNEIEFESSHQSQIEASHHRLEKRAGWALPVAKIPGLYKQEQWSGLKTIVMVKRRRHLWNKI